MGRIFFSDGYKLAGEILGDHITSDKLSKLSQLVYESIDSLIESFTGRAKGENQPVHCKKGCFWCCAQSVFTVPWEVIYLGNYIGEHFTEEKLDMVLTLLRQKNDRTERMNLSEKLRYRHFCPLLEEKACWVYPARPMACRIYLSMDVTSCIGEHHHPDDTEVFAKLFAFPLLAGRMLNEGIAAWMKQQGLSVQEITLEAGLLTVLENREATEQWLKGKTVFPDPLYNKEEQKILRSHLERRDNVW